MSATSHEKIITRLKELHFTLRNGYARVTWYRRRSLIALATAVVLFGIALMIFLEHRFYFPSEVKTGILLILLISSLILAWKVWAAGSTESFKSFYTNFFKHTGRNRLLNAFDLYLYPDQKESFFYSSAISSNIHELNSDQIKSDLNFYVGQKDDAKLFKKTGLLFLFSVLLFFTTGVLYTESATRSLHFWGSYTQPNPFQFTVFPGDTTLEHGSAFQPEVLFTNGRKPDRVLFTFKTDIENSFRSRPMHSSGDNRFTMSEIELTNSITYRIETDEFRSEEHRAEVRLQPRFEELIATVRAPSYTGLSPSDNSYPFSEISLYPGSVIEFEGTSNKQLSSLSLNRTDGQTEISFEDHAGHATFSIQIEPETGDTLSFTLHDTDGLTNKNPYRTILNITEDRQPVVSILDPTGQIRHQDPENLSIRYRASDDFGLTRAELRWEIHRAFVDDPIRNGISLTPPKNGYTDLFNWEIENLDLRPRDELIFYIRVWDNDEVSGPKFNDSNPVTLMIPSLAESFDELDRRERNVEDELDEISENFRNMEREYEEFLDKLRQNPDGGFEEEQVMEEVLDRQAEIDESVQQMNEQFEQLRSEIMQNDQVSEETQRAYQELQQLMRELDDPALREAMEELRKALESMSPQEIEQALENVSFNENLYRERLERTVELFKQLKMNSDLDKLARQYEDLSERLQPVDEQTPGELNNELQNATDDVDSITNQLEKLDQNPPSRSEEQLRRLKKSAENRLDQIKNKMDDLEQQTKEQSEQGAEQIDRQSRNEQQQLSEQLREQADQFRSSISQMSGQQIQVNIQALKRILYTLLELSGLQEYITKTASETRSQSQGFVELARNQKNVADQFSITSDTLFQVSAELPGVPNRINRKKAEVEQSLNRSMDEMVERNQRNASISSREAFSGINDLASMLASLIDQLMNQQNGGGGGMSMQQMIEQMQQMSGDQQQLNQQLQELINDMQGDRLTREQSERLDQLARQQNEIRKQLRELQRQGELDSGDRTLSELQRMIDEMENSINDMRGGITDPIMVERQQNILSRMLDAEESLQQRGEKDEREGTPSSDSERTLPPDMSLEELEQEIRSRLQDPNYTPFTEQFQRLIERYFEQLRRFEEQDNRD